MDAVFDVFLSYRHAHAPAVRRLRDALVNRGLRVWFDEVEIPDFAGITAKAREGIASSKALLAYYSADYTKSRACQWELTHGYLAAQRLDDPRMRILVVNPEPGVDHIEPVQLRDAKYRAAPGDARALRATAVAVADHLSRLDGPLGGSFAETPPWFPQLAIGAPRFVGRLVEMWKIHSALHAAEAGMTQPAVGPGVVFLTGLGGLGKSLLAAEYALRYGAAYPGGVFWLRTFGDALGSALPDTDTGGKVDTQLRALAVALGIPTEGLGPAEVYAALGRGLQRRGQRCLWVVDDVPAGLDAHQVRGLLAPHPLAKTLLTTRSREYGGLAGHIDVGPLPDEDAYRLLTAEREPDGADDERAARLLIKDLGHHAQAIDVTRAALRAEAGLRSFGDYRRALAHQHKDELELAAALAEALPSGHERSIAKTLSASIDRLNKPAVDLLRLTALFASQPIPPRLVVDVFADVDRLNPADAAARAASAIHAAVAGSVAEIVDERHGAVQVHTLVSRTVWFKDQRAGPASGVARRQDRLRAAASGALTRHVKAQVKAADHSFVAEEPLARQLAGTDSLAAVELLQEVARLDRLRGDYARTNVELLMAHGAYISLLGEDHPTTISALLDLYNLDVEREAPMRGWPYLREALTRRQRALGPEHPDTLSLYLAYAIGLARHGDVSNARVLLDRVLATCQRILGEDHPVTLAAFDDLALILRAEGDLRASRAVHEMAWTGRRRQLGEADPATLRSLSNLAAAVLAAGDHANARRLREEAVSTCQRAYGDEDFRTLYAMNALAETLAEIGDLDRAEAVLQQILTIYRRRLGSDHPHCLVIIANLANTLQVRGRRSRRGSRSRRSDLSRAEGLLREEFGTYRQILGEELHEKVQEILSGADRLRREGHVKEARAIYRDLLVGKARQLPGAQPEYLS